MPRKRTTRRATAKKATKKKTAKKRTGTKKVAKKKVTPPSTKPTKRATEPEDDILGAIAVKGAPKRPPGDMGDMDDGPVGGGKVNYGDDYPPLKFATKTTDELLKEVIFRRMGYVPQHGDDVVIRVYPKGQRTVRFKTELKI